MRPPLAQGTPGSQRGAEWKEGAEGREEVGPWLWGEEEAQRFLDITRPLPDKGNGARRHRTGRVWDTEDFSHRNYGY